MTAPAMLSVAEALARVLALCPPLPAETVGLMDGLGRALAEPVTARLTQPPFASSAMDGWAVRAADLAGASHAAPVALTRVGEAAAGHAFAGRIGPGEAVRIFTGAPLPDGADAVVMQEDADDRGATVRIPVAVTPSRFVRPAGLDFAAGEELLPAGRRLTARDVALAAAANTPWLRVRRRPRVAILPTGDEVRLPGEPLGPSEIVSSNAFFLAALVSAEGGLPVFLGVARDTPDSLAAFAAGAAGCDLLVTSGGASDGEHDHMRGVLGGALEFHRVAMRPGRAVMCGTVGGMAGGGDGATRLLGLPGNPVSSAVAAVLFLRPMLRALQGLPAGETPRFARLAGRLPACDDRADYVRATLDAGADGEPRATPFARQDSAMASRLARADALIVRPPHAPPAEPGDRVEIQPLAGGCLSL